MKFFLTLSIFLISVTNSALANEDKVFAYLDQKNWHTAISTASKSGDKLLLKVAKARKFLLANPSENSFEEITEFVIANPDWPQICSIKIVAEAAIKPSTPPVKIVAWFDQNEPATDAGSKAYALAASKVVKDHAKLSRIIRDGWIYGDFTQSEAKNFLKTHDKMLKERDHAKKIDYILWHRDPKKIDGLLSLVSEHDRQMFKAAIAFQTGKCNAEEIFRKLKPKDQHHSIVLYSYLKLHSKDEVIDDRIANLIANAPIDHDHAKEWWTLKNLFARNRLKFNHYDSAYKIAKNHHAVEPEDVSAAEFLAGWLSLRFLKKTEVAHKHFHNMFSVVKQPISKAKAAYWIARSSTDKAEAHEWFKKSSAFNYTFYGQLSELELGIKNLVLPPRPRAQESHKNHYKQNEVARAANMLLDQGKEELAMVYAKAAIKEAKSREEALLIIESFRGLGKPQFTIEIAKAASYKNIFIAHESFPTPHKVTNEFVEPALAYSIMRQETMFGQYMVSDRDARGLMQLIPTTACAAAKVLNMKWEVKKLLTHPDYNIKLGCKELHSMLEKYDGSYILTFAAYNAGPTPTTRWLGVYGDPRTFKDIHKVVDWIESVPYGQTRDYIQRITENLQVYRAILGKPEIRIARDLGVKT